MQNLMLIQSDREGDLKMHQEVKNLSVLTSSTLELFGIK